MTYRNKSISAKIKVSLCLINTNDHCHNVCHKYCYVMHDLTPMLVSPSVSTLLQYAIYTGSVYFIMQLLNSVV
jgi:hypothetical protein